VLKAGREVEGSRLGTFDVAAGRTSRLTRGLTGSALLLFDVGVDGAEGVASLELEDRVVELCVRRCLVVEGSGAEDFEIEPPVLEALRVEVLAVRECDGMRGFGTVAVEEAGARVDNVREGATKLDFVEVAVVDVAGRGVGRLRMDCVRPGGIEGGGIAAFSSFVLVRIPTVGLARPAMGKLEVGTSFVLVERGVSCGS
jgi:hypothetical protein